MRTAHYTVEVDVRTDVDRTLGSMQQLANIVAEGLEDLGMDPADYDVTVTGPPELRIGVVLRG